METLFTGVMLYDGTGSPGRLADVVLSGETISRVTPAGQCDAASFGAVIDGAGLSLSPGWIDIQHFFIAPYYVISYCISNDVALQIYQNELDDGSGLESYYALLERSANNTILALVEEAGMKSPFETGRMAELADFFAEELE